MAEAPRRAFRKLFILGARHERVPCIALPHAFRIPPVVCGCKTNTSLHGGAFATAVGRRIYAGGFRPAPQKQSTTTLQSATSSSLTMLPDLARLIAAAFCPFWTCAQGILCLPTSRCA